jgi:rare lipoprotein A
MRFVLKALIVILTSTLMWGCGTVKPTTGSVQPTAPGTIERTTYIATGKASFYAGAHQSKKTASGEIFDHTLNTAAHKTLPFGTQVRVTNIANGKSVVVKINDRGPFIKNRILDLSKSAFDSIADVSSGIIQVKIEVIE